MAWVSLALSAAFSWGLYGASLHRGQTELGNPMRAMLCVGVAYFLIAVLFLVILAGFPISSPSRSLRPSSRLVRYMGLDASSIWNPSRRIPATSGV